MLEYPCCGNGFVIAGRAIDAAALCYPFLQIETLDGRRAVNTTAHHMNCVKFRPITPNIMSGDGSAGQTGLVGKPCFSLFLRLGTWICLLKNLASLVVRGCYTVSQSILLATHKPRHLCGAFHGLSSAVSRHLFRGICAEAAVSWFVFPLITGSITSAKKGGGGGGVFLAPFAKRNSAPR